MVARDVRDGLVSMENARTSYRVAMAQDGTLDWDATAALRA
jgi:hypothetical protein